MQEQPQVGNAVWIALYAALAILILSQGLANRMRPHIPIESEFSAARRLPPTIVVDDVFSP
jgi:hypothetical protein